MDLDWDAVSHVTKVDPAKPLPVNIGVLEGTDLVIVGGSDDVTEANTLEAVGTIRASFPDLPVLQEPYSATHISRETIERVDYLAVPTVYNGDRGHFVGKHLDLFTEIASKPGDLLGTNVPFIGDVIAERGRSVVTDLAAKLLGEGYVVQHLDAKAATVAGVDERFTPEQVAGAALATETFYGFPIFYVEYSGTYGGPTDVEAAAPFLDDTVLLYGGGIDRREHANEILDAGADAIVVGDCFHEDPAAFQETIPDR